MVGVRDDNPDTLRAALLYWSRSLNATTGLNEVCVCDGALGTLRGAPLCRFRSDIALTLAFISFFSGLFKRGERRRCSVTGWLLVHI